MNTLLGKCIMSLSIEYECAILFFFFEKVCFWDYKDYNTMLSTVPKFSTNLTFMSLRFVHTLVPI